VEDENDGKICPLVLPQLWLPQLSPQVAAICESIGADYGYQMRYQGNALKVWYPPNALIAAGLRIPLAEQPIVKDKWFPHPEIEGEKILLETTVLTYPTMEEKSVRSASQSPGALSPSESSGRPHCTYCIKQQYSAKATELLG
jgi:hypothetical protein